MSIRLFLFMDMYRSQTLHGTADMAYMTGGFGVANVGWHHVWERLGV